MARHLAPLFLCCAVSALAQPASQCAGMKDFKIPNVRLAITQAAETPATATLPAYCRVDGILDSRTGADGKPYGIRFAVALPANWNGSFVQQGGGGLNGSVGNPIGAQATGGNPALARGFAVASSDTGHQGSGGFDGSFMADQQAALDFAYIAIGRLTEVAKLVIAGFYGRAPQRSYYVGCSTGGREAMLMSQRYPSYFDGIIAGAPAMRTGHSNLADAYITTLLNSVAPKDAQGRPDTANALSAGDKKLFIDSLLKACDNRDGIADGMIFDVKGCDFDPATIVCPGAKAEGCLSSAQAAAIKKGFAGPKTARGVAVYPGFFYDTGLTATQGIPGLLNPGPSPVGAPTVATEMDVDAAAARVNSNPQAVIGDSYTWTNLSGFSGHGGKLIFYHGVSDPWFSAQDTLDYYQRLGAANGGASKVDTWSRVFLVPGMGHCQGGTAALDTFDLLSQLTTWVEQDKAPDAVTATGRAFPGRSRPLCAYPKHAQYKGEGDPEKAENFVCRE